MRSILALSAGFASHRCHNLAPTWSGHSKIRKGYRKKKEEKKGQRGFLILIVSCRGLPYEGLGLHISQLLSWGASVRKPGLIVTLNERGRNGTKVGAKRTRQVDGGHAWCSGVCTLHAKPLSMYNAAVMNNQLSKYFAAMGRKSAKARMKSLSAKRRSEIASNAAKSRWAKRGKQRKR